MRRLLALAIALLSTTALAGRHGAGPLPSGVTLQVIDGGTTFYDQNQFRYAADWNTATYPKGWDDPKFFALGSFLDFMQSQAAANRWIAINWNTAFTYAGAGTPGPQLLFRTNNIGVIQGTQFWGQVISVDGLPGNELVGMTPFDEPDTVVEALAWAVSGVPQVNFTGTVTGTNTLTVTGATGLNLIGRSNCTLAFSPPTITGAGVSANNCIGGFGTGAGGNGNYSFSNANVGPEAMSQTAVVPISSTIQDKSFIWTNFTVSWTTSGSNFAGAAQSAMLGTVALSPSGKPRQIDMQGQDIYWMTLAHDAGQRQTCANTYQSGQSAMTIAQCAKGSHYGDMIDYMRAFATPRSIPISQYFETGNGNTGIVYGVSPPEIQWVIWSIVIHGGRGAIFFDTDDGTAYSGGGSDVVASSYASNVQSATFTGSISGTTLTTTSTSGHIFTGALVTGVGVVGSPTVLVQLTGTTGGDGTYTISGGSGSGSWTATQQACSQSVSCQQTLFNQVKATDIMIQTMAPVINAPFAKGYITTVSPSTGYNFPTGNTQNITTGLANGIDVMAKYYTGPTYTTTGFNVNGDTISPGFYIFATTRNSEDMTNQSATFTLADVNATSVTVVNENRTISVANGVFTDNFINAWTVHVYRVNG